MKILISGGSGFIGQHLSRQWQQKNHQVLILTRNIENGKKHSQDGVQLIGWGAQPEGRWTEQLKACDAVVNLAGENIGKGRWTPAKKQRIRESRIQATRAIVQGIAESSEPPKVLLNASAIGYYGAHTDENLTESAPPGNDFLARTCVAWEDEAHKASQLGVRVAIVRTGVVLGREGGALPRMLLPFKFFMGGKIGSGKQWMSWIHIDDLAAIFDFLLHRKNASGPVNATAPEPVTNERFTKYLAKALHRPAICPAPAAVLRLALGEQSTLILQGQRVMPQKLLHWGYSFKFPNLAQALNDLLQ